MEKLIKIAQIDTFNAESQSNIAKCLENAGFLVVYDPEYPRIGYVVDTLENLMKL